MIRIFKGSGAGVLGFVKKVLKIQHDDAGYIELNGGKKLYLLIFAVTAGVTTTSTAAGTLAVTSHATGANQIFRSDGTHWQNYEGQAAISIGLATIATSAGATNGYRHAPFTGKLIAVIFSAVDALAAHDTNYVTFGLTNLGQAGAGTAAMLAATAANTTKITGGTALAANTKRDLALTATGADLAVTQGDRLKPTITASGTLANTLTFPVVTLVFQRTI